MGSIGLEDGGFRWFATGLRSRLCRRALLVGTLCCGTLVAASSATKAPPWEKFDEDDGIAVFRREVPGSAIIALRGEGVVNAPILRVASVLVDSSRATEWIDSLADTKVVRKLNDNEYIEWDHIVTPVILKDRDFVFDAKL